MKYSIKFYPEKRKDPKTGSLITKNNPLILSVSYNGKRMLFYTGKTCNESQWKYDKENPGEIKKNQIISNGQTSQEFNADLTLIKGHIAELFKNYDLRNLDPSISTLRQDLKKKMGRKNDSYSDFFNCMEKYIADKHDVSDQYIINLNAKMKIIKAFNLNITFENCDSQYLTDFKNHLIDSKKYSLNYIMQIFVALSSFIKYAKSKKWTNIQSPFDDFTIGSPVFGTPVFLTMEECDILFNLEIPNKVLDRTRDLFLFECYTAVRIGDISSLKKSNIINGKLEYIQKKTIKHAAKTLQVPLIPNAIAIISKYNFPDGRLFPKISTHEHNKDIENLFKFAGLNRIVTIPNKRTRETIQIPISEMASSHMGRRVFCGTLYQNGVKDDIIASMSGHAEHSKAFTRYRAVSPELQTDAIKYLK